MHMNFQSCALCPFECHVSFELLAFVGAITVINLVASVCTARKLVKILVSHEPALAQNLQNLPNKTVEPLTEQPNTSVCAPPAQPNPPGGARLQAVLRELPILLETVLANPSESLAKEFASAKALEGALNEIFASYPADHANKIFEKLAEDMVNEFTPYAQSFANRLVIRVVGEYQDLWIDHVLQPSKKDSEDARKVQADQVKAGKLSDKFYAKLEKSPTPRSTSATTIDTLYKDLFDTPNTWVIQP